MKPGWWMEGRLYVEFGGKVLVRILRPNDEQTLRFGSTKRPSFFGPLPAESTRLRPIMPSHKARPTNVVALGRASGQ